jgi:hypothetical protein
MASKQAPPAALSYCFGHHPHHPLPQVNTIMISSSSSPAKVNRRKLSHRSNRRPWNHQARGDDDDDDDDDKNPARKRERDKKKCATDTLTHYGNKPRERQTWEMKKKNKKKKEAGTVILRVV